MTLYWWMHWFWVTAQIVGCTMIGVSTPPTETISEDITVTTAESITTDQQSFPITKELSFSNATIATPINKYSVPPTVVRISTVNLNNQTEESVFENVTEFQLENRTNEKLGTNSKTYANKKETMWKNVSKTVKVKYEDTTRHPNVTLEDNLAVMPLNEENSHETSDHLSNMNNSKIMNSSANNSNSQISKKYTEKLIIDSVSPPSTEESLRSNRARGTLFTIGLQRDQTQLEKHFSKLSEDESSVEMYSNNGTSPTDIAIITLSCLATVVLISTAGSLGFIMYRRKYLNPPQTLNSDKCSNPDSSGYIDDSTIRDNSEEMYSLDNDSFLNSLEAMTIQNYWTDSVKHTKL